MDGNFVHTNTITILNSDGKVFDYKTDPNGIGAVIVKAGTGANVFYNNPQPEPASMASTTKTLVMQHFAGIWTYLLQSGVRRGTGAKSTIWIPGLLPGMTLMILSKTL
jgi:hypothetical protein